MHRSGTSLLAKLLGRVGLDLGDPATLIPSDPEDNPDGYFEQAAVVALDDELLAMLGGHVSAPALAATGWSASRASRSRGRGRPRSSARPSPAPRGVFKDPRAAVLLPFWRAVVPDLRVIVSRRRELAEVAASMLRRHAIGADDWMRMWLRHTADALTGSAGRRADRRALRRARVGARARAAAPAPSRSAASRPRRPWPPPWRRWRRRARRRSAVGLGELLEDPRVPPEVAAAYADAPRRRDARRRDARARGTARGARGADRGGARRPHAPGGAAARRAGGRGGGS